MSYDVLLSYMKKFSTVSLKKHLGEDLFALLLECQVDSRPLNSKKLLSEIIIDIYGLSILKRKEFRKNLLSSFSKNYIYGFLYIYPLEQGKQRQHTYYFTTL